MPRTLPALPASVLILLFAAAPGAAEESAAKAEQAESSKKPDAVPGDLTGKLEGETIEALPLVGRKFEDLLTLAPGVTDAQRTGAPNVRGARSSGLQFRLDGADVTDPLGAGMAIPLLLDSIDRLRVTPLSTYPGLGRHDGGVADVLSRSGTNDLQGSFRIYWRGDLLDGNGGQIPSDTFVGATPVTTRFEGTDASLSVGGPIVKDRLWYFTTIDSRHLSSREELGSTEFSRPRTDLGQLTRFTWHAAPGHELSLRYTTGLSEADGLFLTFGVLPESDGTLETHGRALLAAWAWTPTRLFHLDTQISRLDSGQDVTPVSPLFHRTHIATIVTPSPALANPIVQALYPLRECSERGDPNRFVPNCDPALGTVSIQQVDLSSGVVSGPLYYRTDDARTRDAIRAEAGVVPRSGGEAHGILAGFEIDREGFTNDAVQNPILYDATIPCPSCRDQNGVPVANGVNGFQELVVPFPSAPRIDVRGTDAAVWLSDAWRVRSGLVVQASVRVDRESLRSPGVTPIEPRREKLRFNAVVRALCDEGIRIASIGGSSNAAQTCNPLTIVGEPTTNLSFEMDGNTPSTVRRFDTSGDGRFDEGVDGPVWRRFLTSEPELAGDTYHLTNVNLSPRLGVSWDPWAGSSRNGGRTSLFATWGRFHDRLTLAPLALASAPSDGAFVFTPDPGAHVFLPNGISSRGQSLSHVQVSRELGTPYTDALVLGFVRDLTPEWSAGIRYTQRQARDLLQETDLNHITCRQHRRVLGVDPATLCAIGTAPNGKAILGDDLFGSPQFTPNGAPDLYVVNPNFNQVLNVGNQDGSRYRAATLEVARRLHAGWQLQFSYTYSRSIGDAETFTSSSRSDPALLGLPRADLAWDQRHRAVFTATGAVGAGVELGAILTWESGTPYSLQDVVAFDEDDVTNINVRTLYPTGARNDQRNGDFWGIDARVAKRFSVGRVQVGVEAAVENLLDRTDVVLAAYRPSSTGGFQLVPGPAGLRRPGRAWQLGTAVYF